MSGLAISVSWQRALYLICLSIFAVTVLSCADISASFRLATNDRSQSGQALYEGAQQLAAFDARIDALNRARSELNQRSVAIISSLDELDARAYAAKVQFRRLVFQSFPQTYEQVVVESTKTTPNGTVAPQVLSQPFLQKVYSTIRKKDCASGSCKSNVFDDPSTKPAILPLADLRVSQGSALGTKGDQAVSDSSSDACFTSAATTHIATTALECSWTNVIVHVGRHEGALRHLEELRTQDKALSDGIKAIEAEMTTNPRLGQPAAVDSARLLLSFMTLESQRISQDQDTQPSNSLVQGIEAVRDGLESVFDFLLRTLLITPALALTLILSLASGAVGGAYRDAWEAIHKGSEEGEHNTSIVLGSLLGAAVGLLSWFALMTTGTVVGGGNAPETVLDPKAISAIAVAAGLANREAMEFFIKSARAARGAAPTSAASTDPNRS